MERRVNVTVDAVGSVSPKTPQYAGVQGEHNACRVVFDVTAWADEPFLYRGEFVGGDGTGGTTAVLAVEEGHVSFCLPSAWTGGGGRAVARLVASVTVEGEETKTVYAVDVPLFFAAKQECTQAAKKEAYTGFTALAQAVQEAVDNVNGMALSGAFDGAPGRDGAIPEIGANGNWWIDGVDTGRPSRGERGEGGARPYIGANGNWWMRTGTGSLIDLGYAARGRDGVTPTIGANGNWWIGGVDTGKPSRGASGADAVPEEFARIASGVTTEDVGFVAVTADNDGNPLALRDMVTIYLHVPAAATTSTLQVEFDGKVVHSIANALQVNDDRFCRCVGVYSGKKWDVYGYSATAATTVTQISTRDRFGEEEGNAINEIKLYPSAAGALLPVGLEYEIYGRRV